MSEEFETWGEVIVDFFENRIAESSLCKARVYIQEQDKKIKEAKDDKKIRSLQNKKDEKEEELKKLRKNPPKKEIREWIDKSSQTKILSGKRILKSTHVLKFTHSSASSDGFLLNKKSEDMILTTASIKKELVLDLAHNNGALISISRFLALKLNNNLIFDLILDDDFSFLEDFKKSQDGIEYWSNGLKILIETREIRTCDKAKQIYFPIEDLAKNSKYHLLSPLFASSLQEEIKKTLIDSRYIDEAKELRKQKNKKNTKDEFEPLYYEAISTEYKDIAVQKFGGEHPKNVSMLNANRGGNAYLFSSMPPVWINKIKPPLYKESLFNAMLYSSNSQENIDYLRKFLLKFESIDLSIKDPKKMRHLERWVENIIDDVIAYFATIQNLKAGWSKTDNIVLKKEHQALLDPYRDESRFQTYFDSNEWQDEVCKDFAEWLNKKLKGKDKKFTPQTEHTKLWKSLIKEELREFVADLSFDVKRKLKENK